MNYELINVHGVRGYIDENGTAQLNIEDVAKGLGFTQIKGKVIYVRWERVNGYLSDMGFPHLVGKDFIPENTFYRLAMKGETESALQFQSIVADEILPSIRKHGGYLTREKVEEVLLNPDTLITLATQLKYERAEKEKERAARLEAEEIALKQIPLVNFARTCLSSDKNILVRELAKLASKDGVLIGEHRLYKKLRDWGYICHGKNEPTQRAMDAGYFEVKQGAKQTPDKTITFNTPVVTPKGQVRIINRLKEEYGRGA